MKELSHKTQRMIRRTDKLLLNVKRIKNERRKRFRRKALERLLLNIQFRVFHERKFL